LASNDLNRYTLGIVQVNVNTISAGSNNELLQSQPVEVATSDGQNIKKGGGWCIDGAVIDINAALSA
jgi:hypothetical protein